MLNRVSPSNYLESSSRSTVLHFESTLHHAFRLLCITLDRTVCNDSTQTDAIYCSLRIHVLCIKCRIQRHGQRDRQTGPVPWVGVRITTRTWERTQILRHGGVTGQLRNFWICHVSVIIRDSMKGIQSIIAFCIKCPELHVLAFLIILSSNSIN